jgi:hypothetical protein
MLTIREFISGPALSGEHVMTATKVTPEALAAAFCRELSREITAEQVAEVVTRNAAETNENVCHSHDFCDANEVMLDAWLSLDEDADVSDIIGGDEQHKIWNEAWAIAKAGNFQCSGR